MDRHELTPSVTAGPAASPLEMWAGVECTVNRVGDQYFNQFACNGHGARLEDLDRFAALGIRTLRYPVLWETTAPDGLESADWSWADTRLPRLTELGIRPIVGLVHHGSGPRHTSLIDPAFPEGLAEFARAVAERFPTVEAYTPVNEPLTTARFSGMYGHWYPHGRDASTFARALLTQCRATVLAMRAIREINPQARLVQTEDLGKIWSTPALAYQAEFENTRRWLSFDLLCGRVDPGHRMWQFLRWVGIEEPELDWFLENPCPPDLLGINHYLTSERFLDERLERYPTGAHGGNGQHRYADVEAVRVVAEGLAGPKALLQETWERYHIPVAVTEAHLGCTREEQVRWLLEVWRAAQAARQEGADIRAVTAWSLLGAYDWDSLLTRCDGCYEPGVFDLRSCGPQKTLRPTALAGVVQALAEGREPEHPVLATPGWWRRPKRLLFPPVHAHAGTGTAVSEEQPFDARPLLITGANGMLARAFVRLCDHRGLACRALSRADLDIADAASVASALEAYRPWAVVNAAGFARVDAAEHERYACLRENVKGAARLAQACAKRGIPLLAFSSDLVFDGTKNAPYVESDAVHPLSVYGRGKAQMEAQTLAILPSALIARTSALFGPWDEYNFAVQTLRTLAMGQAVAAADDQTVSPTYAPDLVHACLDLLIDGEKGIWHLVNEGALTWADFARRLAERAGFDPTLIEGRSTQALGLIAPRPAYSVLGTERGALLPSLEEGLNRFFQDGEVWRPEHHPVVHHRRRPRKATAQPHPRRAPVRVT